MRNRSALLIVALVAFLAASVGLAPATIAKKKKKPLKVSTVLVIEGTNSPPGLVRRLEGYVSAGPSKPACLYGRHVTVHAVTPFSDGVVGWGTSFSDPARPNATGRWAIDIVQPYETVRLYATVTKLSTNRFTCRAAVSDDIPPLS